jgi:hypothetical protein
MSDEEKSYRLKYVGKRFDGMRLPVEVLSDLPAFRDLLAAYAKNQWIAINNPRKRVPRGFDKSISFDLVALEEGSAISKLEWNPYSIQPDLEGFSDELSDIVRGAFNSIAKLIDDAGQDIFPQSLSAEHVRALNKLGAGLQSTEKIEFLNTEGKDGKIVYLDSYRRKKLITCVRETYQTRFQGTGILMGVMTQPQQGFITVNTAIHGPINIQLDHERLVKEFDGYIETDVQFDLQIELDNSDKFRSVVDVYEVELIEISPDLKKCRDRIAYIQTLPQDWNGEDGAPAAASAIRTASFFLTEYAAICSQYHIYPTDSGGILIEFEWNEWDFSVEFSAAGKIEMYGIQIGGEQEEMQPKTFNSFNGAFKKEFDLRLGFL